MENNVSNNKFQTDIIMSAIKVKSKIYNPMRYNEAIADLVYERKWKDVIEEELSNLE